MRCFRLRKRDSQTNRIVNHRDYIGLDKLKRHGAEVWSRYNLVNTTRLEQIDFQYKIVPCEPYQESHAELCELIDGKWKPLSESEVNELIGMYL